MLEQHTVLELLRREGLIIVAIGALVWQVYWMTSGFSAADKLWREEMTAWRIASMETNQTRTQAELELAHAIRGYEDRINRIEQITERIEKECQIFMAINKESGGRER